MKDTTQYLALTAAVNNYNERHCLNRGYLADAIGFNGDNAARQLSNYLNPNNDNKIFNHRQFIALLYALDEKAKRVYFDAMMKPWGFETCKVSATTSGVSMHTLVDDAMIEGDEAFKTVKLALRDNTLDEKELTAIEKEASEAQNLWRAIAEQARARRVREFGGE